MQTATLRPRQADLGREVVDVVLRKMQEDLIIPDAACYEAAMSVWKNAALHPEVEQDREDCVRRCWTLLSELRVSHLKTTSHKAAAQALSTRVLNDMLQVLSVSQHSERTQQADALLHEMEANLETHDTTDSPVPNFESYQRVMQVWQSTSGRDRLPQAKAILWRCKDHLILKKSDVSTNTTTGAVEVLNAFCLVCATTPSIRRMEEGLLILLEALAAVDKFKDCGVDANQWTYIHLLNAAKDLLPLGLQRQRIVEKVFTLACEGGMVDDHVLSTLLQATTSDQYSRLVIAASETVDGSTKVIPEDWSRNVLGGRVVSADGRRVVPVGIDGRLTRTKAMQDFQMRRLRDQRNRKLLQGGRWDRSLDP